MRGGWKNCRAAPRRCASLPRTTAWRSFSGLEVFPLKIGAGPRAVGTGLLVALFLAIGLEPPPLDALRDAVFDGYQRLMPRLRASAPAVMVAIDERAQDILAAGPAAVGVDLLFVEPDRSAPGGDAALADAIGSGKVVMGIA